MHSALKLEKNSAKKCQKQTISKHQFHIMSELALMLCKWSNEFEGRCISLNKNRPIWAGAAAGDFAVSQKRLTKTFQFYGKNLA